MAKSILLRYGDEPSAFGFSKLDRAKLYGYKERQVVDADGQRCSSAYLTGDGAALVPTGGLAMLYVDDRFGTVERSELRTVAEDGSEIAMKPSTLGIEQPLEGPVPPQRVLDHVIHTVYQLAPEQVGDKLGTALAAGQVFSAPFCYREEAQHQTLFLLEGENHAVFALVGEPHAFDFIRRDAVVADTAGEEDELSDDLDFSMM